MLPPPAGYLSEAGASTLVLATKPQPNPPNKPASTTTSKCPSGKTASVGSKNSSSNNSSSDRPLQLTDAHCKAQRHLLENQLRAGEGRLAQAFNAALHDRCTNMAAAVATLPPAPITPMPHGTAAAAGQDWGSLVSSSIARSHLVGGGGGARSAAGSSIKVTKAAKAIVEDVQRAFAASTSPPPGKGRHKRWAAQVVGVMHSFWQAETL